MVTLNDYLYNGDTVLKILHRYNEDLKNEALATHDFIDLAHSNFLLQIIELLEHNDFLTLQSQRIREFYELMVGRYPHLAFTFKGRIKSLIRAEEKFNGNIVEYIYDYYLKNKSYPSMEQIKTKVSFFRDLIAYRIVISTPRCHLAPGEDARKVELDYLYEIANILPEFMEERGFSLISSDFSKNVSDKIAEELRPFYRDYISSPTNLGYQSLHVTFYDNIARCYIEMQLRTKEMDDYSEIGPANHLGYEKSQEEARSKRDAIPVSENKYFDKAYERGILLQQLDLSKLDVNMFGAINNSLINDGCGLFRGRQILPYEHLSRFQNDLVRS